MSKKSKSVILTEKPKISKKFEKTKNHKKHFLNLFGTISRDLKANKIHQLHQNPTSPKVPIPRYT